MRKIVRQQNYLKELIESQGNRFLTRQALKCLVRSALEPLLDEPETGVVLYRIENKDGLQGLLKRLEFSDVQSIDYSDEGKNLVEKVWANTEFLCTMTHRYVSILIWDNNTGDKNLVRYYSLYNSKLQNEPLDIIKRNSKVDISEYQEKFTPDRRDNILLNASIRRLLDNMDEAANDAVLGYAEKSAGTLSDSDYAQKKSRVIAHEVKNQLSICDLYTEIIRKYAENGNTEGIKNSLKSINKALKMANNSLLGLKTKETKELKPVNLKELVETAVELSSVYLEGKDIEFSVENSEEITVLADYDKLIAVIINLVKNASEAFPIDEENGAEQAKLTKEKTFISGKYIKIKTEKEEDFAQIQISNNAKGIENPEKIFEEGFTTKATGSGLGLWICRKSVEEQLGQLELTRTSEDYTEFTISLGLAE